MISTYTTKDFFFQAKKNQKTQIHQNWKNLKKIKKNKL